MTNKQKCGDGGTNISGETVTVNKGLSIEDTLIVAKSLFEENFPKLQEKARDEVNKRTEIFLSELKTNISERLPNQLFNKFSDPDIQYNLLEIQKKNARYNIPDLRKSFIDLLIKRIQNDDSDIKKIVINEAIGTIEKLTLNQIKILALCFSLKYSKKLNILSLDAFDRRLLSLMEVLKFEDKRTDFQHIEYCSCANIGIGSWSLTGIFKENYKEIFSKDGKSMNDSEIEKEIIKFEGGKTLMDLYKKSALKNLSLTSVGIVIAILFLEQKTLEQYNLDIWIN